MGNVFNIPLFLFLLLLGITPVRSLQSSLVGNHQKIDVITDEYLQRKFPFLTKTCSKEAVSKFIPLCVLDTGIDSIEERIKVETAIKLSVCEFENSGLQDWIPRGCFYGQPLEIVECMTGLEIGGQWWTTYSGYYQNLNEICYQYSLPFEQEKLLGEFLNLTDMISEVSLFWSNEFGNLQYESDLTINKHVDDISNFFNELFVDLRDQDKQFKEELITSNEVTLKHFNEIYEVLTNNVTRFNNVVNSSLEGVNYLIQDIVSQIHKDDISKDISQLNKLKENAINLVVNQSQFIEDSILMFHFQFNNMLNDITMGFTNTQIDTLESINQYQMILEKTLNKELTATMGEVKDIAIEEWTKFSEVIEDDIVSLNFQFTNNIDEIDKRLSNTVDSIDKIEGKLSYLTQYLSSLTSIFSMVLNIVKNSWILVAIIILSKLFKLLPHFLIPEWISMILKIFFMIYVGKYIGHHTL
ncbi:similar to Saccharomyces cerevisiae YMR065W KAR5 Protein required for nuclear membrane fusion during karyogamy [Maudiozyma saulgeensis]|uniref:Nuclear fusion protein KAR5 n=1 Tax=Maudiozyma saulgeensis TaxID=1789683 RepID=A0A1X7RA98_9SACH|nr:similar to Saccharomyces cerevisiae YMR065W KAR5 Protein required for nuclear membrane fusion during karyogamy [Kazachstania saulgeensis]